MSQITLFNILEELTKDCRNITLQYDSARKQLITYCTNTSEITDLWRNRSLSIYRCLLVWKGKSVAKFYTMRHRPTKYSLKQLHNFTVMSCSSRNGDRFSSDVFNGNISSDIIMYDEIIFRVTKCTCPRHGAWCDNISTRIIAREQVK